MTIQYPFIATNRNFKIPMVEGDYQSITPDGSLTYLNCNPPYDQKNSFDYGVWLKLIMVEIITDRVMIFIHGFDNPWSKVIDTTGGLAGMLSHFSSPLVTTPYAGPIILFDWPSFFALDKAQPCKCFDAAKSNATNTAKLSFSLLKKIIDDIQATKPQTKIDIVCHSMGNYVLQQSLQASADPLTPGSISTFLINAAAISNDAFVQGSVKTPTSRITKYLSGKGSVHVLWSSNDDALPAGELCDRWKELGLAGPALGSSNITNNDLSSIVTKPARGGAPNVHTSYYYIKEVLDQMISMMAG